MATRIMAVETSLALQYLGAAFVRSKPLSARTTKWINVTIWSAAGRQFKLSYKVFVRAAGDPPASNCGRIIHITDGRILPLHRHRSTVNERWDGTRKPQTENVPDQFDIFSGCSNPPQCIYRVAWDSYIQLLYLRFS